MDFCSEPIVSVSGCTKKGDCYLKKACADAGCKLSVKDFGNGDRWVTDDSIRVKDNVISDVFGKRVQGICHLCLECGDIEIKVPNSLFLYCGADCNKFLEQDLCLLTLSYNAESYIVNGASMLKIKNLEAPGWITLEERKNFEQQCRTACQTCRKIQARIAQLVAQETAYLKGNG